MKLRFLLAVALVAVALSTGVAAAQEDGNVTVDVSGSDRTNCTEHIGEHVSLCSASVEDGRVTLELISDEMMIITITDAGAMMEGGRIPQADVRLRPDRRTTFQMDVTQHNGFIGVTIDTGDVLWGKKIQEQQPPLLARPTKTDAFLVGSTIFGLFVVALPASWFVVQRQEGGEKDVF